jgi:hypothetical protein
MSTLSRVAPVSQPAFTWIQKHIWPCEMIPNGMPGLLQLEGQCYMVSSHQGSVDVFVLVKTDGTAYVVDTQKHRCSCPHAIHRRAVCKHSRGLVAAIASLWATESIDERDPFEGATEEEKRFWLGLDDAPTNPPPAGPAALPVPTRKPNHNFAADVA